MKKLLVLMISVVVLLSACAQEKEPKQEKQEVTEPADDVVVEQKVEEPNKASEEPKEEEKPKKEEKPKITNKEHKDKASQFEEKALNTITLIRLTIDLQVQNRGDAEAKRVALKEFDLHKQSIDELEPGNSKQKEIKKSMQENLKYLKQFVKDNAGQLGYDLLDEWEEEIKNSH